MGLLNTLFGNKPKEKITPFKTEQETMARIKDYQQDINKSRLTNRGEAIIFMQECVLLGYIQGVLDTSPLFSTRFYQEIREIMASIKD